MRVPAIAISIAAAVAAPLPASAQTANGVQIYGLLDTGMEYITNTGPSGSRLIRQPTLTATQPSRLGFRGREDLGGNLSAVFVLESGLGLDTGVLNQGGRIWGRQSYVGLNSTWGNLTFGRQYSLFAYGVSDTDIMGPSAYGLPALDAYVPNARADNSVAYLGTVGGFTAGAEYSLGRDAVNAGPSPAGTNCPGESATDSGACRQWSVLAQYKNPTWGISAAFDRQRGGAGAFGGLVRSDLKDDRLVVGGFTMVGKAKIATGLIRRDNGGNSATPRSDLWYIGGSYPLTDFLVLDSQVFYLKYKDSPNNSKLAAIRAYYYLSKRTGVYIQAAHITNGGLSAVSVSGGQTGSNPAPGQSQSAVMAGVRVMF